MELCEAPKLEKVASTTIAAHRRARVLIFIEANRPTTGPAKNAIEFARRAPSCPDSALEAHIAMATFHRGEPNSTNEFVSFCQKSALEVQVIHERTTFDPSILPAIRKLVDSYRPDIIETHAVKSHFLTWLTGIYRNRVWIAFHHGYTWTDGRTRAYNHLDHWSLPVASTVVTDCRPFAAELENHGVSPDRIALRHSSVNEFIPPPTERISELRRLLRIAEGTHVILSVGRLSKEKGQFLLIEAAALLRRNSDRNVCFVLAGDGPDREMLEELAAQKQLSDSFRFVGHVAEIAPYYALANIFVLPSYSEGSPNVLLEAMAAGLPIVATAVGGVPEMIEHRKQGLLVECGNPSALAESITQLRSHESLRRLLASAGRQRSKSYSSEAYCGSLLALYESCLTRCSQR